MTSSSIEPHFSLLTIRTAVAHTLPCLSSAAQTPTTSKEIWIMEKDKDREQQGHQHKGGQQQGGQRPGQQGGQQPGQPSHQPGQGGQRSGQQGGGHGKPDDRDDRGDQQERR